MRSHKVKILFTKYVGKHSNIRMGANLRGSPKQIRKYVPIKLNIKKYKNLLNRLHKALILERVFNISEC